MERNRLITLGFFFLWLFTSLFWLQTDQLLRDGDEEGHVGAAELMKQLLSEEGFLSFLQYAVAGNLGEYPPLYASFIGLWWAIVGGLPEDLVIRGIGLSFVLVTALCSAWLAKMLRCPPETTFVLVLFCPLLNGIGRHFMIEGLLCALTALLAATLYSNRHRPTVWKSIVTGIVLAAGLLTKQSFILTALPILILINGVRSAMFTSIVTLLLCLPWYWNQWSSQTSYVMDSIQANTVSALHIQFLAPISFLLWDISGPVISLLLLYAFATSRRRRIEAHKWMLLWLGVSLLLFWILPKKYPRLLLGLTPAICIYITAGLKHLKPHLRHALMIPVIGWFLLASYFETMPNPIYAMLDNRCQQVWMRPPFPEDFGLKLIAREARKIPNTPIVFQKPSPIPCSIQTTHPWEYHLEIYLRR
ncbi:MAG: hypothetical protein VX278_10035, partial [Myxococcota bacterium]|nr:hypothetical protein [Myxococcota bacterium]